MADVPSDPTVELIEEEEGRVASAYNDSLGFLTIGVGHLIDRRKGGRLPDSIIDALRDYDINEARQIAQALTGFNRLNPIQKAAVVSMAFQLGAGLMEFHDFRNALARGDVTSAAAAGLDSAWAKEDPHRAERETTMLKTALWIPK